MPELALARPSCRRRAGMTGDGDVRSSPGRHAAIALVTLAVGVVLADGSVVTLALPEVVADFDVSVPSVAWVLTSYNLILALAAVPAAHVAGRRPLASFGAGLVVAALASIVCATTTSFAELLAARCVQALGGGLVLGAAFTLLVGLTRSTAEGARLWVVAGVVGASVGPAAGGILTQGLGWRSIFVVQVPLLLAPLVLVAAVRLANARVFDAAHKTGPLRAGRPHVPANVALLLISGALSAALFLLVVLLVSGWRIEPFVAGVIVTVMPVSALAIGRLARRFDDIRLRAAAGTVLAAGGLTALAVMPHASWWWTVPPQILVGAGLGLTISALTQRALAGRSPQAVHGGWSIASRHAGVVLGLLIMTPLFTSSLAHNRTEALRAGTAIVLDSDIRPLEKVRVVRDVVRAVDDADRRVPDVQQALAGHDDDVRGLGARLQGQLDRAATRAFSSSFLAAALLALLALVPIALRSSEDLSL